MQARKLPERVGNRSVRRAYAMKHISCDQDDIRLLLDDPIERRTEGQCDVALSEIDATDGHAVIRAKAEVQVREMCYPQSTSRCRSGPAILTTTFSRRAAEAAEPQ